MPVESIVLLVVGMASGLISVLAIQAGAQGFGVVLCMLVIVLAAGCLVLGWRFWRHPFR
jgi:hypothetical protein